MKSYFLFANLILAGCLFLVLPVIGQSPSGSLLQGAVTNEEGGVLAGANITVFNKNYVKVSDNSGHYRLELPSGDYTIKFSHIGYQELVKKISLVPGKTINFDVTLSNDHSSMQQVEITGRKARTYKVRATYLGSKSETSIKDLPQSVSYASKELIADQGSMRVGEVVKNFSGVNQFTFYDDITIRGFRVNGQSNTQLINGMRTSTGFWKQPLANYLERVEVLKGPASALYGNASPGGVVNRVTKKPLDENRKSVSVSMGSFNTFRGLTDFTGPANKDSSLLYRLNLGYENAGSFRDLQFDKNIVIAPSISFIPGKNTRLNFDMVFNDSRSRLDRGQAVIGNDLYSTPTSLSLAAGNDYLNEQTYTVSVSLNHRFSNLLSFTATYLKTGYSEDLYEHRSANAYAIDSAGKPISNLVSMQIFSRKRKRYIDNFSGFLNFTPVTGILQHSILLGYDYGSEQLPVGGSQLTASGYRNPANTGTTSKAPYLLDKNGNPVPNVPSFNLNDILNSQRLQDDSKDFFVQSLVNPTFYYLHAGYLQDQVRIGRLQALVGMRYEYYTDFSNYKQSTQQKTHSSALLPRFGLVLTVNENINLYGTYVTGYNPQTASTLSNPNAGGPFDPLKSDMTEFGTKTSWLDDRLNLTAAVYQIRQKNTLYNANVAGQPDLMRQIGQERSRGIEFDVTGQLAANWSIIASYAYIRSEITDSPDPKEIGLQKPNAPKNLANIWTRYNIVRGDLHGLGIGGGVNYVDQRNLSINQAQTIPAYTLFNAAIYYNMAKMQLQLNWNNIGNKTYWVGGYDYIRLFPGASSNYLMTLTYNFQ